MSPGEPKLKSNDIVKDIANQWKMMSPKAKVTVTDPLLEKLISLREDADMKLKIAPVHVLNDVSATMVKINREVCPCTTSMCALTNVTHLQLDALHARTGFETIVFGVRSSADHYTAPIVHATSPKILTFFDVVVKKPVTDLATSIEAFCLSGVDGEFHNTHPMYTTLTSMLFTGVIGKLVKHESQLRGEVVASINAKLCTSIPHTKCLPVH